MLKYKRNELFAFFKITFREKETDDAFLKKLLAAFLCAVLLCAACSSAVAAIACDCGSLPIVYVLGRSVIYKTTDDWSDENKAEGNLSGGTGSVAEPLTAENANVSTNTSDTSSFLKVFGNLFRTFFAMLKNWLSGLVRR